MTNTNIGRKRKKTGFTQISNSMLEDDRLSWKAKGLLAYMLSRPNNWKINKSDLYKRATEGRDAMTNGLEELKNYGYLHIYPNKKENGRIDGWIWEYDDAPFTPEILESRITENPQKTAEIVPINRHTEKQQEKDENVQVSRNTENPSYGKTVIRNSSIYNNTDFNNTDLNNTKAKKKKSKSNSLELDTQLEKEFEEFWKLYPRRSNNVKKTAKTSFIQARKKKKIPYETIVNGLYKYKAYLEANNSEEEFIAHTSTWLNQERWENDYLIVHKKKKAKSFMDLLEPEFGGNENYEHAGNAKIIDHDTGYFSSSQR